MVEPVSPADVIRRIAQVADAVSFQAGVGGMETAGMIVSVLAKHPELIDGFLTDGPGFLIDNDKFGAEHGCLNFHNQMGGISRPEDARRAHAARRMLLASGAKPPPTEAPTG